MSGVGTVRSVCTVVVLSMALAACATRQSPASYHPSPFPNPASPESLRPGLPAGPITFGEAVVHTALRFTGVPYRWGGDEPGTGFDCSGFVQYVLGRHQVAAPRTSAEQYQLGQEVALDQVRAGDLVFFSTISAGASHVGLALNNEEFVHAPAASGVVRVERVRAPYWSARYVGARRVF